MLKITPFLWFDTQAEAAANFYVSVFPNSKIVRIMRNNPATPGETGGVLTVDLILDGQPVIFMNGGPAFTLSHAFSFVVHCADQAQVDHYWDALIEGGAPSQCGWLTDRFGLSWQITPQILLDLMHDPDPAKAARAAAAMMTMVKLDIDQLKSAAAS